METRSQRPDEGVPRASGLAISAETVESASPFAFAEQSQPLLCMRVANLRRGGFNRSES